jgi:hypothetical protein
MSRETPNSSPLFGMPGNGRKLATQEPWNAEPLGANRFRFTNTSGDTLAMILLTPIMAATVSVENGEDIATHVLRDPIFPGASFVAVVCGPGVHVTATAIPARRPVYWTMELF